jgi:hypothetical protein
MYIVRQNYGSQLGNNMGRNIMVLDYTNQYTSLGNKLLGMDI